ncbi:MAG: hypothetical protein DCC68_14520 [Planctomycetota bacterium]|nr:MAG: hypothetical protein DCC68_14520 [Planctomycetota bacterium]
MASDRLKVLAALAVAALFAPSAARSQDPATPAPAPAPTQPADAAPAATAGKWKEDTIAKELAPRSAERSRIQRELNNLASGQTTLDDAGRQIVDTYFSKIFFAEMTQVANITRLHEARHTVRRNYLRRPNFPEALRTHINGLILTDMGRIAGDNGYHPAVRVNAMLMIADLNAQEAPLGAPASAAKPLPAALSQRGGLLDAAEDTTLHAGVRAMALYGVQRHADAGLAPGNQPAVMAKMAAILKEKPANAANSQAIAWLKARAATVLATMGAADASGAVPGELATIVIDSAASVDLRCSAAKALGSQKGLAAGPLKLPELIPALGNLHLDACRAEIDRAAYEQDTVAPRQIHFRASAVQAALGDGKSSGVVALIPANDAQKTLADAIAKNVSETLALVPDENAEPTEQVKLKADELEKILADAKVLKSQPRATAAPTAAAAESAPADAAKPADAATTGAAKTAPAAAGTNASAAKPK